MTTRVGVITEDPTDGDTITVLIQRLKPGLGVKKRGQRGCSMLEKKAHAWMQDLARQGCTHVILLRDLDRNPANGNLNDEHAVRSRLERHAIPRGVERLICIPIEELEAWFWADPAILSKVSRKQQRADTTPASRKKPKEELARLSRDAGGKPLYSTNDNEALAKELNLELCAKRCPAFKALSDFVCAIPAG